MKSIIFDWSGVIKDAVDSQLWIINRMFQKHGIGEITLEEFKENWEQPYQLFYNKYLPNFSLEQQKIDYKEAIFDKDCPVSPPFPGIIEVIKELKNCSYFLAVVTTDLHSKISEEIKRYNLESIFDEVITDVYDKFEAVDKLVKEKCFDKNQTYIIGDSNHEIDVGKKSGIKSVAVTWGFCSEQKLRSCNPDFVVRNIEDLERVILQQKF